VVFEFDGNTSPLSSKCYVKSDKTLYFFC